MSEGVSIPPPPLRTYASLAPFRKWLRHGSPVLMYHKLGPRPARTRLKGLYVSAALFRKQLREFAEAGYTTPGFDQVLETAAEKREVFLTFDDGFENVLRHGLGPLAEHRFKAIQFLVADRLGKTNDWETCEGEAEERLMDVAQVREWLAAGHEIGAHTLTHPRLTKVPESQAREEITSSKRKLEDLFGQPIRHFCYPYGDHNERVVDLVRGSGYSTACLVLGGLVAPGADALRLRRLMARYASRSPKSLLRELKARWAAR